MASGQCFAQAVVKEATMLALVLNRSSRVIPKTQPGEGSRSPTVTITGRKCNQNPKSKFCSAQTHIWFHRSRTNSPAAVRNWLPSLIERSALPRRNQPNRTHSTEAAWVHCDHTTHTTGAQSSTTAPKMNSLPSFKSLPQLQFKWQLLCANIAGCVSATPHCYCSNQEKWRLRKSLALKSRILLCS